MCAAAFSALFFLSASQGFAADKSAAKLEGTLVLSGFSPVEVIETGSAAHGDARFASAYQGWIYNFPNAASKAKFDAAPEKYAVKLEGNCPVTFATGAKVKGNPQIFALHDKKIYLLKDASAKAAFDREPAKFAKLADAAPASAAMPAGGPMKKKEGS